MAIINNIKNAVLRVRPAEGILRGTDERTQIVHINYDSLEPIAFTADGKTNELYHDFEKVNWPWNKTTTFFE